MLQKLYWCVYKNKHFTGSYKGGGLVFPDQEKQFDQHYHSFKYLQSPMKVYFDIVIIKAGL